MADKQKFIQAMVEAIGQQPDFHGLFPSVMIAQGALESGWGESGLARNYNNYFGVKASSTKFSDAWDPKKDQSVNVKTSEYLDGGWNNDYRDNFRVYRSMADSLRDRNAMLSRAPRYAAALKAATPDEQARLMWEAGYATDPDYVGKIVSIINANGLRQYDKVWSVKKNG